MSSLKSNFAGSFYPNNPAVLKKQIETFLNSAQKICTKPKAIITPHAGYIFSGKTAGYAYKQLENEYYSKAIILGPSHQVYSNSLAIPAEDSYVTPLGKIDFDIGLKNKLTEAPIFTINSTPHYQEHSLEVQIPFIQTILPNAKILPISVGQLDSNTFLAAAATLNNVIDSETILIISTDLSHFKSLNTAKNLDERTINYIMSLDFNNFMQGYHCKNVDCCGVFPIALALATFEKMGKIEAKLLAYDTSASSSFDDSRVVGYGALAFY